MNNLQYIPLVLLAIVAIAFGLSFIRFMLGPSRADRVIALDTLTIVAIGAALTAGVWTRSVFLLDIGLLLALLAFVSTVAFAYYQERRNDR